MAVDEIDHIDVANSMSLEKFVEEYFPPGSVNPAKSAQKRRSEGSASQIDSFSGEVPLILNREQWKAWTHPTAKDEYEVSLQAAKALSESDFESCFRLIEYTSSLDYKKSKDGWKPRSKRKEMKLLDLKYVLVKQDKKVEGFVSLMPTYEDGYPVIYCYEIHLSPALQGTGLGTVLMKLLEEIGARIPGTEKVMLTCFTSNARGVKFYKKLGYAKDEFSPPPKILRNGTKVEAEYVILSKSIR